MAKRLSPWLFKRGLATSMKRYDAVVIGAGPGGLTAASNLIDHGFERLCIIDPSFTGGRINDRYREVPSNTKAGMFTTWATNSAGFKKVLDDRPSDSAFDKVRGFDQDDTCSLGDAIDMARQLSDGMRRDRRIDSIHGHVTQLQKDDTWRLPEFAIETDRVILATGSHPSPHPLIDRYPALKNLDLDTCLKPSLLRQTLPSSTTVGVIGASHSAILALKNLHEQGHKIINFYRTPLLYAEYKKDWILWDNTGLKGLAARWAKETLEDNLPESIQRINLKQATDSGKTELDVYDEHLKGCSHLLSAIGFTRNTLPVITQNSTIVTPEFDAVTGTFSIPTPGQHDKYASQGTILRGLYGTGIAFPELVTDPEGHKSMNVGWKKFDVAVKRWMPQWSS